MISETKLSICAKKKKEKSIQVYLTIDKNGMETELGENKFLKIKIKPQISQKEYQNTERDLYIKKF